MKRAEAIAQMENLLDILLTSRPLNTALDVRAFPKEMQVLGHKLNKLASDFDDTFCFARELAQGNVSLEPPNRKNIMASPLKELHSQMLAMQFSMEQLDQGKIVGKLYQSGKLYQTYNKLIDKVSRMYMGVNSGMKEFDSSWRYHQILAAINRLSIMIMEVLPDGEIVYANPPVHSVFADLKKLPYESMEIKPRTLLDYLCSLGRRMRNLEEHQHEFPLLYEMQDAESGIWYHITSDVVTLPDGAIGMLHVIDDISTWKQTERILTEYATIDSLTGMYTRWVGLKKLEELLQAKGKENHCIAFIDLDNLKCINDHYGHNEGDVALRNIAKVIKGSVRAQDWVIRFGGDEFLLLFMNCTPDIARKIIDRMYDRLKTENQRSEKEFRLSFSVGISEITEEMETADDVIRVVDALMYEDKRRRKG